MPKPTTPVIAGLEKHEIVYGANQPEYIPLPALRSPDGRVMSRWELSAEERQMIADGADVLITIHTFNNPYPPTQVDVAKKDASPDFHAGRLCLDTHFQEKQTARGTA